MNEYKLTLTVTIKAQDDPAAREQARGIMDGVAAVVSDAEAKLKQVYDGKPPRGVQIA